MYPLQFIINPGYYTQAILDPVMSVGVEDERDVHHLLPHRPHRLHHLLWALHPPRGLPLYPRPHTHAPLLQVVIMALL